MNNDKKIYCYNCGTLNDIRNDKCINCKAKLHKKEHPILVWLFGDIFDEIKGNIFSKICQLLISFLHLHLYGFTLGLALVFTVSSSVFNFTSKDVAEITRSDYRIFNVTESVASETKQDEELNQVIEEKEEEKKEIVDNKPLEENNNVEKPS